MSKNHKPHNKRSQKQKLKVKIEKKSNRPESSHLILKNTWEEDSVTWKLSKVALNLKSYKKRNSNLTLSETHSTSEMIKANNKNNLNNKPHKNKLNNPSFKQKNPNKKNQRRRKTIWKNSSKPWRNLDLEVLMEPMVKRKRKKRKPKSQHNKPQLPNNNLLNKPLKNNHQQKISQLTSKISYKS